MNEKPLISVIVPVYNVAAYIDECVKSIVNQTYSNLEIILVDDGSTDESKALCDAWGDRDSRVLVIHKENGGVSTARNAGLWLAKGSYISFVDGDDYIDINMYESLLKLIIDQHAQVAGCQFVEISNKGLSNDVSTGQMYLFSGRETCNYMLRCDEELPKISWSVWIYLYARDIAKAAAFEEGIFYYEDGLYTLQTIWQASKVAFVDKNMYFYRLRDDSVTRETVSTKYVDDMIHFNYSRLDFYQKNATQAEISKCRWHVMMDVLHCRYNCSKQSDRLAVMQFYKSCQLGYADVKGRGIKNIGRYFVYRYFWQIYKLTRSR